MTIGQLIARRLALLVFVLLGVTLITFVVSHVIGDPVQMLVGQRADPELVAQMRHRLGLDRPLLVQYGSYLGDLLRGDMGVSLRTQRPVAEDLWRFFPATLELSVAAMGLALLVGVPLGVLSATRQNSWVDHIGRALSVMGVSTPLFWLGLMALLLFYGVLGLLPGSGRLDPFVSAPPTRTGFLLVDSLLAGDLAGFSSALHHLILPAACLGWVHVGVVARQVRASMLEVLGQDYVRTARASGLPRRAVVYRHALRNALIPTVTVVGLSFGDLLGGAVMTETIFNWPGMGTYVVDSIAHLDFPAIMGFTLFVAAGYVLINLLVDVAYMLLDPQIRGVG